MARSNILAAWQTKLRSENMGAVVEMVTFRGYQHGLAGELGVGIGSFRPRGFGTSASPVRWATAAVTWDGNAIPARIIERSDITQKAGGEHEVTLTLSALPDDVPERSTFIDSDVVYSWIEPGGTTELTLMRGLVTAAEGDEKKVVIRVAGHMSGNNRKIPAYTTTAECPMMFRGLGCGYVKTTDIVGAQPAVPSGTDILCVSTADLEVGRYLISDPNGTPTPVEISAITDATNFQVGSTSTWADADAVMYADCRKTFIDCAQRKREHAYRGFRATQELRGSTLVERLERYVGLGDPWTPSGRPIRGFEFMDYLFNLDAYLGSLSPSGENTTGLQTIFDTTPVNIPYGRVVVRARMIERHHVIADPGSGDVTYAVGFYLLGRGEIDGVEAVYTSDYQLRNYIEGGGPDVPEGTEIYWRPGKDGSATQYTEADWQSDRATMTTASDEHGFKLDEGKTDFRTNTGTAYSGVGYMIVMMPLGRGIGLGSDDARDGLDDLPEQLLVRLRGVKVQKYLTNGAPDGAKAFSQNPWWCLRDLLDDGLYGHGVPSDIYQPASWKSSADYADAVITNQGMRTEVRITMAQPLTVIPVNTVEGFLQGQTVEISSTDYTVEEIDVLGQALVLDTALQLTEGDTIVGERERFIVALDVNRQKKVKDWVKLFISAARGHLRMDGDQLAAFTELGIFGGEAGLNQTDLGYQLGTKPRSFKFHGARESKNRYNQLEITYTKGHSLGFETALMRVPDADAGGLAAPKPKSLDLSACPTPEQALRCGLARYAKIGALGNGDGNNDFSDVGITLTTGPNALETMVGEHFEAQRRITPEGQSQRTTTKRGRIVEMVLTRGPKFSVKLKALPERQQLRMEAFGPSIACFTDTPYVAGLSGRPYSDSPPELPNPTITLQLLAFSGGVAQFRLVFTGGGSRFRVPRAVELHASTTSGFTPEIGVPNSSTRVASWRRMSYVLNWVIPDELLGETLYFIATARQA
ncbi:MAG: hypothetical protein GY716_10325, partial [bacterium]|nr:hypothetical protein [bacterium]